MDGKVHLNTRDQLYCFDGFIDALLGHGQSADRAVVTPLRTQWHRQDDVVAGSEAAFDWRRRTLLERRRHLQYRMGLLRKAVNLTPESEPDIFQASRFGAVLENQVLEEDRTVNFTDTRITENTRGAYPI